MIDQNRVSGARIAEVPIGSELALLESGGADVVMMLEPAASIAESKNYYIVTSFPNLWGPFAFTGLTSTASLVKTEPETVAAIRKCLQQALNLAREHRDQTKEIAIKLFPTIDRQVIDRAVDRMVEAKTLPSSIVMPPEAWAAAIRIRSQMGELKKDQHYDEVIIK